jgi:hypothetical protein
MSELLIQKLEAEEQSYKAPAAKAAIRKAISIVRQYEVVRHMKTAPRDGTHILAIYQRNPEAECQHVEIWFNPSSRDETGTSYEWRSWDNSYPDDNDKLLCWRELPSVYGLDPLIHAQ